eukprot:CAMPEP_0179089124 /NCGR_PEP_ID=MMETSP0796-20121207/40589_1 /TAXON_ID=73915 /ORGANISM="Pyrodinium bahamense, Strain pbaha01" /LENGTH=124 /DNA_ID=CAMNT_0020786667 /DNA_START=168 /DNA_END=542 /DNA_ORIENTATION=+
MAVGHGGRLSELHFATRSMDSVDATLVMGGEGSGAASRFTRGVLGGPAAWWATGGAAAPGLGTSGGIPGTGPGTAPAGMATGMAAGTLAAICTGRVMPLAGIAMGAGMAATCMPLGASAPAGQK